MLGKRTMLIATCFIVVLTSLVYAEEDCEGFTNDAEAIDGIVPSYNEDGDLISIKSYGQATFLVPKRSLINSARKVAVLRSDRHIADFYEKRVSGYDKVDAGELTEGETNQAGEETATSKERVQLIEHISSYTPEQIISGMVTLDECVDTSEKVLLVERGWKPEYSRAGDEASAIMRNSNKNDVPNKSENNSALSGESQNSTKITPSKGYRKKSSLKDSF